MTQNTESKATEAAQTQLEEPVVPVWLGKEVKHGSQTAPRRWRPKPGVILAVALCAAALIYGLGVHHYSTHFVPGTTVGGIRASGLSVDELARKLEDNVSAYQNHVTGDGLDFDVKAVDIALKVDGDSFAADAHAEINPYLWPFLLLGKRTIEPDIGVTFSQELLDQVVAMAVEEFNQTAEAPTNADAAWDAEQQLYVQTPSAIGTAVDPQAASEVVTRNVAVLSPKSALGKSQLALPAIGDDDQSLADAISLANSMVSLNIPLTLDGKTLYTIEPSQIAQWVGIYWGDEGAYVWVDQDAILQWSYDNLNQVVNGESETRTWEVNSWDVAAELAPKIAAVDGSAMEVPTITISTRPEESEGHEQYGRHIDVNLTTQYARLYDADGKTVLWRSPFVSGNEAMGHYTPDGEFEILNMEQNVVLTGLNDGVVLEEGEEPKPEDLYNSYVDYWMCFLGTEYGLHDATWRDDDEFGGDTYKWNGSHGCINLPHDAAGELYSLIHVGDKVIIHY